MISDISEHVPQVCLGIDSVRYWCCQFCFTVSSAYVRLDSKRSIYQLWHGREIFDLGYHNDVVGPDWSACISRSTVSCCPIALCLISCLSAEDRWSHWIRDLEPYAGANRVCYADAHVL